MNVPPESRGKIIGLLVLIVATGLYFLLLVLPRLMNVSKGANQSAVAASAPVVGANAAPAPMPASPGAPPPADLYADVTDDPPTASADPFSAPVPTLNPGAPPTMGPPTSTASLAASPLPGLAPAHPVAPAPVAPPPVAIELQGVVLGAPEVAVVRIGDKVYYKMVGDWLPEGMRIKRIEPRGILLSGATKRIFLGVGHSTAPTPVRTQVVSAPSAEPAAPSAPTTELAPTPLTAAAALKSTLDTLPIGKALPQ